MGEPSGNRKKRLIVCGAKKPALLDHRRSIEAGKNTTRSGTHAETLSHEVEPGLAAPRRERAGACPLNPAERVS